MSGPSVKQKFGDKYGRDADTQAKFASMMARLEK
jgi:hypothetical protein